MSFFLEQYYSTRPNIILQLHCDLYSYSQGNFIPVPTFQTAEAIDELCAHFLEAWETNLIDKLILIPMFILDFLCIHPFNDGKLDVSRVIMYVMNAIQKEWM